MKKYGINKILLLLLYVVLPLTYGFNISDYILGGIIFFLLFIYLLLYRKISFSKLFTINHNANDVNKYFLLCILWLLICLINGVNSKSILRIVQMISCFLSFLIGCRTIWQKEDINFLKRIIEIIILIIYCHWMITGFKISSYSFIYKNPNSFASIVLYWSFVIILNFNTKKMSDFMFYLLIVLLTFFSTSRATLLCVLIENVFLLFFIKHNNNLTLKSFFYFSLFALTAFVYIYISLIGTELGYRLQDYSWKYFNKNFFSGRQLAWPLLVEKIKNNFIIGYGLGVVPANFTNEFTSSGHNLYLQTALQSGIIGVFLLYKVIKEIYYSCIYNKKNKYSLTVCAIILTILLHETFEISLTQNMIVCGIQGWLIFGLGCNNSIEEK